LNYHHVQNVVASCTFQIWMEPEDFGTGFVLKMDANDISLCDKDCRKMFLKYEKTYRIRIPQYDVKGKFYLSDEEVKLLLAGAVSIEEKIDGANTGIIRHKKGFHLQKRGSLVGQSEHPQFGALHNWANGVGYDKIMAVPPGHLIYGEWAWAQHTIFYDKLPDYFLAFDVMHTPSGYWFNLKERFEFCETYGFSQVPLISMGYYSKMDLFDLIPGPSAFGEFAEGIVVKRYRKGNNYLRGKIVKPEFMKTLDEEDEHWTKRKLSINKLAKEHSS
jgi:ATP-dependent RNA circularization protein (DNA/RNA ligase family)